MTHAGARNVLLSAVLALGAQSTVFAQQGQEPFGGQPPQGAQASVKDLDYQLKYQRAFEATLWAIPAAAIYRFRGAAFDDLGLKDNDIISYSAPATPKLGKRPMPMFRYYGPMDDLNQKRFKMPDFELVE